MNLHYSNRSWTFKIFATTVCAVCFCMAPLAQAGTLFVEAFDYTAEEALEGKGSFQYTQYKWANAVNNGSATIKDPGLSRSVLHSSGNAVLLEGNNDILPYVSFRLDGSTTGGNKLLDEEDGSTLYMSVLIKPVSIPNNAYIEAGLSVQFSAGQNFSLRLGAVGKDTEIRLRAGAGVLGEFDYVDLGEATSGTTYHLVMKFTYDASGNETFEAAVNPSVNAEPNWVPVRSVAAGNEGFQWNFVYLRAANGTAVAAYFDEFRIATTYKDALNPQPHGTIFMFK